MQDMFGSVRRSLVFRLPDGGGDEGTTVGTLVDKINSCIRKSRVFSKPPPPSPSPPIDTPPIRWRKGELIGCGAFGRVYMGMNLDSGELLAVKQVLIASNGASKEKAQAHVKELEEEVKLLKNLSHPNIVRYLGTVREEETLNILLEFVPGGSISSLLGKFGSFPEAVIRMYTKQLLLGLDYLHKNGIMHRDIKGANILVDNKGCIKLADFGASKQVIDLVTISGAKSMKGTPYWMAPEVIRQTGHNFSADIWSVGCTVIEMATGKPPWSQQYQEVAALFYIGTTKSHPPIPENLSDEAKDFLLKCLQQEPELRPPACELLQHPFVTGEPLQSPAVFCTPYMENSKPVSPSCGINQENSPGSMDICNLGSLSGSTVKFDKFSGSSHIWGANNSEDDMCQIDERDDFILGEEAKLSPAFMPDIFNKSFNPICEPSDDWMCKDDESLGLDEGKVNLDNVQPVDIPAGSSGTSGKEDNEFHCGPSLSEDDDELTESKIRAFLDEKALELKKLQTPLYEEFFNSLNTSCSTSFAETTRDESSPNYLKLPPKSRSPNRVPAVSPSSAVDGVSNASPGSSSRRISNVGTAMPSDHVFRPDDNQEAVFVQTSPIVTSVLDGYNVCIFAYGQTGTGKTFTMEGTPENRGVNYQTLEDLFRISNERSGFMRYELFVSMLEVYNEKIRDLLIDNSNQSSKKLEIKQAADGTQEVPGLVEAHVYGTDEVWELLKSGSQARSVGSTNANEFSSRSHCLLRVTVNGESLINGQKTKSHLWLVDLAGSERMGRIEVEGERLKESQFINKSLSALGDVISALASKTAHIPYRNSKLTHMLQSSLGGDCKTLMFVQISPSAADLGETLCSLNFASRVRGIEHGPARKQADLTELFKYKQLAEKSKHDEKEIKKLRDSLQSLQLRLAAREHICRNFQDKNRELESQLAEERKTRLKQETRALASVSAQSPALSSLNQPHMTTIAEKKPPMFPSKLRLPLRGISNFLPPRSPVPPRMTMTSISIFPNNKENVSKMMTTATKTKTLLKARRGSYAVRPPPVATNQVFQPKRRASIATLHPESNSNIMRTPLNSSSNARLRTDRMVGRQSFVWDPQRVWRASRVETPLPRLKESAVMATPIAPRSSKFRGSPPTQAGSWKPKHPTVIALQKKQLVWSPLKFRGMRNSSRKPS